MLLSPECHALRQRITLFYDLLPLTEDETINYVAHRLKVAGTEEQLFTSGAIHQIQSFTRGYPRLINIICDRAMLTGYVKEQKQIDADIVAECAREISLLDPTASKAQRSRRKLIPLGLAVAIVLLVVAVGIGVNTKWNVKPDESIQVDQISHEKKAADSDFRASQDVPEAATQMLKQEPAQKDLTSTVPENVALVKKPSPEKKPKKQNKATKPPSAKRTPKKMAKAPQPTKLKLAIAALEQQNFKEAIELFEADRSRDTGNSQKTGELYSKALVGQASQIMKKFPSDAEDMLRKAHRASR